MANDIDWIPPGCTFTARVQSSESTRQGSQGLIGIEATNPDPVQLWISPLHTGIVSLVFFGTPNSESGGRSDTFASVWDPFPPIGLPRPAVRWGHVPRLIVTCYAMFWLILMGGLLFSEGKWRSYGSGGRREVRERLGRVKGGETEFKM